MSQENVEIVQRLVEAVNCGDADAFVALSSPDVEWQDATFFTDVSRSYRGRQQLRDWFTEIVVTPWEHFHGEVLETLDGPDNRVYSDAMLTARGRGSGIDTRQRAFQVFWIANGTIARREVFRHRSEALEAAGLSE